MSSDNLNANETAPAQGLSTPRLLLLPWQLKDSRDFLPIASDREVMRYIGKGQLWPEERVNRFVQKQIDGLVNWGYCLWQLRLKASNALIGFCGLQPLEGTDETEIGWWLARSHWGQGLATEAAREALRDAFERARLARIVAIAHPANHASIRIMSKLGMRYERTVDRMGILAVLYSINSGKAAPPLNQ